MCVSDGSSEACPSTKAEPDENEGAYDEIERSVGDSMLSRTLFPEGLFMAFLVMWFRFGEENKGAASEIDGTKFSNCEFAVELMEILAVDCDEIVGGTR